MGEKAQTNIDFVISVTVFVGAVLFGVQFIGSTADPLLSDAGRGSIEPEAVGDRLYTIEMSGEDYGELNLGYLLNGSGEVKNESQMMEELSVDANGLSLEVVNSDGDTVKIDGDNATVGDPPPDAGAEVRGVRRIGHTETNGTVAVDLRVW